MGTKWDDVGKGDDDDDEDEDEGGWRYAQVCGV
jgi:hypothetical protein